MNRTAWKYAATLILACAVSVAAFAQTTVEDQMKYLHDRFEINFVYDAALDMKVPYSGPSLEGQNLERCLEFLFGGKDISWEIKKKYVVLNRQEYKARDYSVLDMEQTDTLSASRIVSHLDSRERVTQTGMVKLDARRFNSGYALLSSPDIIKTLQNLPGVSSGTELMSGLYVRGGTGNDNLFLLDGVPLYQITHLAGLFSSFNTDVVDDVLFYKSGYPARYGSRLSSVVDITTRDGDFEKYHGTFSIGLIDGRLQLEGPLWKGRTSFNVAMRRSWMDVVTIPVMAVVNRKKHDAKQDFRYYMQDFNVRLTHRFSEGNALSLNMYHSNDGLKFLIDQKSDGTDASSIEKNTFDTSLKWGNNSVSLNWKCDISDKFKTNVIGYYTMYNSVIGYNTSQIRKTGAGTASIVLDERNRSGINDIGLKAVFGYDPSASHRVSFGTEYVCHMFRPSRKAEYTESNPGQEPQKDLSDYSFHSAGHEASVFVEDEMKITGWLRANAGIRYALFGVSGKIWHGIEPRAALRFQCGGNVALKLSYSEMNQFCHQVATTYLDLPTSCWMPSTKNIRPMHSRQAAAGIYVRLPYHLKLDVEGFYKTMEHIREYGGINTLFPSLEQWESTFKEGKGLSYGVETEFAYETEKTLLSVCYTLSWSKRKFEDFWYGWFPDRNDNRHKVTVTATHKFNKRIEAYMSWNYHTGNRITVTSHQVLYGYSDYIPVGNSYGMNLYEMPNNLKLPDYHRLDLGVNFRKTTKRGNERVWNISFYNVYCRMNAVMAYIQADSEGKYKGYAKGMIPIIPSFSYSLKF